MRSGKCGKHPHSSFKSHVSRSILACKGYFSWQPRARLFRSLSFEGKSPPVSLCGHCSVKSTSFTGDFFLTRKQQKKIYQNIGKKYSALDQINFPLTSAVYYVPLRLFVVDLFYSQSPSWQILQICSGRWSNCKRWWNRMETNWQNRAIS